MEKTLFDRPQKLHYRAARVLTFSRYDGDANRLFRQLNWNDLSFQFQMQKALMVYSPGGWESKVKVPSVGGGGGEWIFFCNYTFQNLPTIYRHGYALFGYPLLSCNELRNPN